MVLDAVVAGHRSRISQARGAYYQFLRRNGINANAELWQIAMDFGLDYRAGIGELDGETVVRSGPDRTRVSSGAPDRRG